MEYDLELDKLIQRIKEKNHKRIIIQLPDGLKRQTQNIVNEIKEKTNAEVLVWMNSCYGACDIPLGLSQLNIDLFAQFGHNRFIRKEGW